MSYVLGFVAGALHGALFIIELMWKVAKRVFGMWGLWQGFTYDAAEKAVEELSKELIDGGRLDLGRGRSRCSYGDEWVDIGRPD
jgi:hypothetical protein